MSDTWRKAGQWLIDNQDKRGTPDWDTMERFYRSNAPGQQPPAQQPTAAGGAAPSFAGQLASETMSGANEGFYTVPAKVVDMLGNAVWGLVNAGYRGVTGSDENLVNNQSLADAQVQAMRDIGISHAPQPGFETYRKVVETGAESVAPMGLIGRVPGAAKLMSAPTKGGVAREATAGGAAALGGEAGEQVGRMVGGDTGAVVGQIAGELVGGGSVEVPGALRDKSAQAFFGPDDPTAAREAVKFAQEHGAKPTLGLVGNRRAAAIEAAQIDNPAEVSGLSGRINQQYDAFEGALLDQGQQVRGDQPRTAGSYSEEEIGFKARDAARDALANVEQEVKDINEALDAAVGKRTPVDVSGVRRGIRDAKPTTAEPYQEILTDQAQGLEAIRNTPLDQTTERGLRERIRILKNEMKDARVRANPDRVAEINNLIADAERRLDANAGVAFEQMRDFRTSVRDARTKANPEVGLPEHTLGQVEQPAREALRATAERQGAGQQFDETMERTRQVMAEPGREIALDEGGDVPYLRGIKNKEAVDVFNEIAKGGQDSSARLDVLWRNLKETPDGRRKFADLAADIVELMGRANPGQMTTPDTTWSPVKFHTNWVQLPPQTKLLLTGGNETVLNQFERLANYASFLKRRTKGENVSHSGRAIATILAAPYLISNPGAAAGVLGVNVAADRGILMNQKMMDAALGDAPEFTERLRQRLGGMITRMMDSEEQN